MTKYAYTARNDQGVKIEGSIEAASTDDARKKLAAMSAMPLTVKAQSRLSFGMPSFMKKRLKAADLILFTKQFRTLFNAGVPITRLLQILQHQSENAQLKQVAAHMTQDVTDGKSLSAAFRVHPKVFGPLYCSMIEAGELAGSLGSMLDRLVFLIQHDYKMEKDIATALRYPKMVLMALTVAFFVLLNGVIPKFAQIFSSSRIDLPWPTLAAIGLQRFLETYWYLALGGVALGIWAYGRWVITPQGRYQRDTLLLHLPIIGPVLQKAAMARFASSFSVLQASGVATLSSMTVLINTIGNAAIAHQFSLIQEKLREGRGLSGPLKNAKHFTPLLVSMVAIGEESGNLEGMLNDISAHYDEEVEYAVGGMTEAVGPILLVGLTVMVGFFALAIFLPMWDMSKIIK